MRLWACKRSIRRCLAEEQIAVAVQEVDLRRPVVFIDRANLDAAHAKETLEELHSDRAKNNEREAEEEEDVEHGGQRV